MGKSNMARGSAQEERARELYLTRFARLVRQAVIVVFPAQKTRSAKVFTEFIGERKLRLKGRLIRYGRARFVGRAVGARLLCRLPVELPEPEGPAVHTGLPAAVRS